MLNVKLLRPCAEIAKLFFISCLFYSFFNYAYPAQAIPEVEIEGNLKQLSKTQILNEIKKGFKIANQPITSIYNIKSLIRNLYLQRGNPNAEINIIQSPLESLTIQINENLNTKTLIEDIVIKGGSRRLRGITRANIRLKKGQFYNHDIFKEDIKWIRQNFFVPVKLILSSDKPGSIIPIMKITDITAVLPIANFTLTDIGGLGIVLGASAINPFKQNNTFRFQTKRNNLKFLGETTPNLIQDMEYIASFRTQNTPNEQMNFGGNVFNKVDYIFDHFRGQFGVYNWISNQGVDIFTGFPIWNNPQQRYYLRGVFSLAFIQDNLYSTKPGQARELSRGKTGQDRFILPTLSLIYADLDNYQFPSKGNFIRGFLRGGTGASQFIQPALESDTFFSPWEKEDWKLTLLIQNRAGVSLGDVPFYRGFLNAQSWFIRGAPQFSIFDESSLKFTQEARLIYSFKKPLLGQNLPDFLRDWKFYTSFFLDEGAYWNRQNGLSLDKWQVGAGMGIRLVTPGGLAVGVDFTAPVYPRLSIPTVFLQLNSGFYFHADSFITEGFFKR